MSHRCYIYGSATACFEENNELWIKEYADGKQQEGRTYKVKFCPQCGYQVPETTFAKSFFGSVNLSDYQTDDKIAQFSQHLSNAVAQMNYNISLIKSYMSTQTTQNGCFLDAQIEFDKRLKTLEDYVILKIKEK